MEESKTAPLLETAPPEGDTVPRDPAASLVKTAPQPKLAPPVPDLPTALPELLLPWYRANARDLPWRHTRDPYRIWVSEVMLQQTRVAAVLGYYARFLETFPTVEALAAADEEPLLSLWQGLGYYSRARSLHRAAKQIAERGAFPDTYGDLCKLPGVGEYTAGAIASAAFGLPVPAVDGNHLRVLSRLTDCHADILSPLTRRRFREALSAVFPHAPEDARIFNQSLMEVGAVVCVPNGPPRCEECPLAGICLGRQRGTAQSLPVRAEKKARREENRTVFVLLQGNRTAVRKRPEAGLLAGLWEFPNVSGTRSEQQAAELVTAWGLRIRDWHSRLTAKHIFTHVEWHMTGYVLTVAESEPSGKADAESAGDLPFLWVDRQELQQIAIPSAFARFREEAARILEEADKPSGEGDA